MKDTRPGNSAFTMGIGGIAALLMSICVMSAFFIKPVLAAVCLPDTGIIVVDGMTFTVGRDCKGENWNYDADQHTLFLDGYNGMYIDLSTQENAVISLSGKNTVASHLNVPAILVDGSLTIEGEGSLTAEVSACHCAVYAKNGDLTVRDTSVQIKASGVVEDSAYLLMADGGVEISGTKIQIEDEIEGPGGAIGAMSGNLTVCGGTDISVSSASKGLTALEKEVHILDQGTSLDLVCEESAVYAKLSYVQEAGTTVHIESKNAESTALYCPEGDIHVTTSELKVKSEGAAMAGELIIINDAYVAVPEEAVIRQVSAMVTVTSETGVAKEVHILPGVAPTPTPTPTPTPIPPSPTPTPVPPAEDGFIMTPRMILGGVLVIVALVTFAVILVGKVRGRD